MRVRDRATLDLLILSAVHDEAGDGAAVVRLVQERSGVAALSVRTVHPALHRLERNRLVHRPRGGTGYRLTPAGTRVLHGRRREFDRWVRAVRAVLPVDAPAPRRAGPAAGT